MDQNSSRAVALNENEITVEGLAGLTQSGELYAVVDVRERGEYIFGHIPGATSIPRAELEASLAKLLPAADARVVVCCDDGARSRSAAETLRDLGIARVSMLRGGTDEWVSSGRQLSFGFNEAGKEYGEQILWEQGVRQISADELESAMSAKQVLLVDVRPSHEYSLEGHIAGARNVPGGEAPAAVLTQLATGVKPDLVVVNCAGRTRGIVAAELLTSLGVGSVYALENGTMGWILSNRELRTGDDPDPLMSSSEGYEALRIKAAGLYDPKFSQLGWTVDRLTAARAAGEPIYVLDVRGPDEFQHGHIRGAHSCPVGQITNFIVDTVHIRNAAIICYSRSDVRSRIAVRTLVGMGVREVHWLEGGMGSWDAVDELEVSAAEKPAWNDRRPEHVDASDIDMELRSELGPILLDIRRASEFVAGHLPGAVWLSRGDLERWVRNYAQTTDSIILIASADQQARLALRTLSRMSFRNVRILFGGVVSWINLGRNLVEGVDQSGINIDQAREEADLVGHGPAQLRRTESDMLRYLDWEEELGIPYKKASRP